MSEGSDVDRVRQESGISAAAERWLAESLSTTSQSEDALEGYPKGGGGVINAAERSEQAHGLEDSEDVNGVADVDNTSSSSASAASASSSEFDFSSTHPFTVGDIWGSSKEQSGAGAGGTAGGNAVGVRLAGGNGHPPGANSLEGGDLSSAMSTPGRDAAFRLESLTATVAAAVAEVAAETYPGSVLEGFNTSTSGSRPTTASSGGNPLGGLPLAGSRSPPPGAPAPGRRRETDSSDEGFAAAAGAWSMAMRRRSTADTCNSDRPTGWLPLAGSRSPPAVRLPGHREPDSSGIESLDVGPPLPPRARAARATSPPRNKSARRERRQRHRGEGLRGGAIPPVVAGGGPVLAGAVGAASSESSLSSVTSSAPLDLSSAVSGERGGIDGTAGGLQRQRDAEYAEEEVLLLRTRTRSEDSGWEKRGTSSDDYPAVAPRAPGGADRKGSRGKGARVTLHREGGVGFRGWRDDNAARRSTPGMFAVTAGPAAYRMGATGKLPGERWRGVDGRRTSAARAAEAVEAGPGLRSTHFAPGYVGVAWPDPLEEGGAAKGSSVARARLLTKLEDAASRKLADIEERGHRARRERSDRTKRRWVLRICICGRLLDASFWDSPCRCLLLLYLLLFL